MKTYVLNDPRVMLYTRTHTIQTDEPIKDRFYTTETHSRQSLTNSNSLKNVDM